MTRATPTHRTKQVPGRRLATAAALMLAASCGAAAQASLGGRYATVEADRAHMGGAMRSTSAGTHMVHALTSTSQGTVREFTRPDGTVFAVAWRGPARPDLRQILGASFDGFQSSITVRGGRRLRGPLAARGDALVVRSAGHPGAFWGFAYLPQALPSGFSVDDLQ